MTHNLPLVCLDPRWLTQALWIHHPDGRVVRAGLLLLTAAWQADPAAHLIDDRPVLAQLGGISEELVDLHREVLLSAFAPVGTGLDGRTLLRHDAMYEVLRSVEERFGEQTKAIAAASTLACLAPEADFDLGDPNGRAKFAKRAAKGVRSKLRDDFEPDEAGWAKAAAAGYLTAEHRSWLRERFLDVFQAKNELKVDWQKTWSNFVGSSFTSRDFFSRFGKYPRDCLYASTPSLSGGATGSSGGRSALGRATFNEMARSGSASTMGAVLRSRFGGSPGFAREPATSTLTPSDAILDDVNDLIQAAVVPRAPVQDSIFARSARHG